MIDETARRAAGEGFRPVDVVFRPTAIALLGASDAGTGGWSTTTYHNLRERAGAVHVYPLNPNRATVWGERCFASFAQIPEPVDLALTIVPAPVVGEILREGAAHGPKAATVYAAGLRRVSQTERWSVPILAQQAAARGLGFSCAASVGNEVDLDVADYINFFVEDEHTTLICCFAEGIRRPAAFVAAAEATQRCTRSRSQQRTESRRRV